MELEPAGLIKFIPIINVTQEQRNELFEEIFSNVITIPQYVCEFELQVQFINLHGERVYCTTYTTRSSDNDLEQAIRKAIKILFAGDMDYIQRKIDVSLTKCGFDKENVTYQVVADHLPEKVADLVKQEYAASKAKFKFLPQ